MSMVPEAISLPEALGEMDGIAAIEIVAGEGASGIPDLFFEVPHGATAREDYERLRAQLSPELPDDLIDYFFVNTDVGAYEYAHRAAELIVAPAKGIRGEDPLSRAFAAHAPRAAARSVVLLRCLIPRTFIDTNRAVDATREEGGLSAALGDYVRSPEDVERLGDMHAAYHAIAERLYAHVLDAGGLALNAHTYAPRSISIDSFDEGIGRALRQAYEPDVYDGWPLRPEVDVIADDPDGVRLAPPRLLQALRGAYEVIDVPVTVNGTYTLHPASMGNRYARRHPGRILCLEVRRDLLADPFDPFVEMNVGVDAVDRIARPLAAAFLEVLAASPDDE